MIQMVTMIVVMVLEQLLIFLNLLMKRRLVFLVRIVLVKMRFVVVGGGVYICLYIFRLLLSDIDIFNSFWLISFFFFSFIQRCLGDIESRVSNLYTSSEKHFRVGRVESVCAVLEDVDFAQCDLNFRVDEFVFFFFFFFLFCFVSFCSCLFFFFSFYTMSVFVWMCLFLPPLCFEILS